MKVTNYVQKIPLPGGKYAYVQEPGYRARGQQLIRWCKKKWTPPACYFHYQRGGHVAALKTHLGSPYFAAADFESFYSHVTRNKIARALKRIGFRYADAHEYAVNATISDSHRYYLPYGFVESVFLATLCLEKSKLGNLFREIMQRDIKLSVYVDDVVISGMNKEDVAQALDSIERVGSEIGFPVNTSKLQRVGIDVLAFNIHAKGQSLVVADDRMSAFEAAVINAESEAQSRAILAYVATINQEQANGLKRLHLLKSPGPMLG